MAKMKMEGGHELATPTIWLMMQAGVAFTSFVNSLPTFSTPIRLAFDSWARKYGLVAKESTIPLLQLGLVPSSTFGFTAYSLKAFSRARQYMLDGPGKSIDCSNMPVWHNAAFKNNNSNTYYCPKLTREGILTVGQVFTANHVPKEDLLVQLAPTWQQVYQEGLSRYKQLQHSLWSLPSTWMSAWGTSALLKKAASSIPTETRQPQQVWASYWNSKFPPNIHSFVYQTLWKKLKVGDRLEAWTHQPNCPICHRRETVEHATSECAFHPLIHATIEKCLELPEDSQNKKVRVTDLPVAKSLKHPSGVMLWVARAAHWSVRNSALHGARIAFDFFLETWIKLVSLVAVWELLAHLALAMLEFHSALIALKNNGVLVHAKIKVAPSPGISRKQKKTKNA
mmetsp:Transcript_101824/g.175762  ORF Transcript_101824/g.175762 Transcript_101824/m.175762 type:complete len:396 (-) Transcript_101824:142-1329(-)